MSGQSERPFSLSWSHYVFLLGIKKADERSFYEIESTKQNWTLRELRRQFQSGLYERLALSRDQDGIRQLAKQAQIVSQPQDLLKEPLVLEFLGLSEQARYSESDLEAAIINQIEHFLLELGKGFLFEARQKRCRSGHRRHCAVQEEARGTGRNHSAQRREHPRPGIPALFAEQRRIAAEIG